jgi:hypothetical protein
MKFRLRVSLVVLAVLSFDPSLHADELLDSDIAFLHEAKVDTNGAGLLNFLRSRSLSSQDQAQIGLYIRQLGHQLFPVRERASAELIRLGPPALPFLRQALIDGDLEVVRRARFCIEEIERGPGPALPAAAVRLLRVRKPAGSVTALLNYLPFTDDESVEGEVLAGLVALGSADGKADPALTAALQSPLPQPRSAAALVLGRLGDPDQRETVRNLLKDPDPKVRLRAAQGLIAARERSAIPVLIALLSDAPLGLCWQAEEVLYALAGPQAPPVSIGEGDPETRKRCLAAWTAWWRDRGDQVDLSKLEDQERQIGLTLIAELDSNKVWECGPDGKARWKMDNLQGPIDAQVLPGGRILVAENQGQRVTERDLKGNILWEKKVNQNPIACQRLPNGNTFIACYQSVLEVTRDGKEVYSHNNRPGFFIFGAHKLRDGRILCISAQGAVLILDSRGKELRTFQVANNGGWCGVEGLPGGHMLVAVMGNNKVTELDANGKTVWECSSVPGPCAATRLPNGHTLVASMGGQRVVEVDRAGKVVWEKATEGRPFRVHRR